MTYKWVVLWTEEDGVRHIEFVKSRQEAKGRIKQIDELSNEQQVSIGREYFMAEVEDRTVTFGD